MQVPDRRRTKCESPARTRCRSSVYGNWQAGTRFARRGCMAGGRHDNLRKRTFEFAVAAIRTARPLVPDPIGRHLVGQVVRSAGSVAANYDGACHARSRKEFAAKVGLVAEESSETAVWLRILVALDLLRDEDAKALIAEAGELAAIATASARTASRPSSGV